jgi:hypothetical protein
MLSVTTQHPNYWVGLRPQNYKKIDKKINKKAMHAPDSYNYEINFLIILSEATIFRIGAE